MNEINPNQANLDEFRQEVREFLANNIPSVTAERCKTGYYMSKDEIMDWHKKLATKGWSVQNWPVEVGGTGWSLMQKYIYDDEAARAGAPVIPGAAVNMVGTLLNNFGSEEQKRRFLPPIRSGEQIWCQGWSEASAGSDLASLKCAARLSGSEYIINGTKLWTSNAHRADWCMLLTRTSSSERKQEGITILLVDMKTPGITVRPIISLDGMHSLNEVHFQDVHIPAENRVGDEGKGWPMMRGMVLDSERLSAANIFRAKAFLDRLFTIARQQKRNGKPLIEYPPFRRRLTWLELRLRPLRTIYLELVTSPRESWGTLPSVLKMQGTRLTQDIVEMTSEAAGYYGIPFHPHAIRDGWGSEQPIGPEFATPITPNFFYLRQISISGGASEIHRNMIAKEYLG